MEGQTQVGRVGNELNAETIFQYVESQLKSRPSDSFFNAILLQTLRDRVKLYETFHSHDEFSMEQFLNFYKGEQWVKLAQVVNQLPELPMKVLETWEQLDESAKQQMSSVANNMLVEHRLQADRSVGRQIEILLKGLV